MYGNNIFNNNLVLRYSLTKEFFDSFKSLKYSSIELPLTMVKNFHNYIKGYVDTHHRNINLIIKMKKMHSFISFFS
ncbi:hypothetical protein CR203_03425 [Salipaludibacillus neizhouensis]|uniref:Uncharacterized protein n=1 Tax=Salipaludibacillus neizhouensis TaxID=885475 RepID=A0A3A9KEY1_9BACI|nr:hypothetical protein CR203_03425 [Salipaludibacillus neizhouensis]